jgi:hypothetical protein
LIPRRALTERMLANLARAAKESPETAPDPRYAAFPLPTEPQKRELRCAECAAIATADLSGWQTFLIARGSHAVYDVVSFCPECRRSRATP